MLNGMKIGSMAEWVNSIGTILAIFVSAWIVFYKIKTSNRDAEGRFSRERNIVFLEKTEEEIIKIGYKIDLTIEKLNVGSGTTVLFKEIIRDLTNINRIYSGGYVDKEKNSFLRALEANKINESFKKIIKYIDIIKSKNSITTQDLEEIDKELNEILINIVKIKTNILIFNN